MRQFNTELAVAFTITWLAIAVGPWWVAVIIFAFWCLLNILSRLLDRWMEQRRDVQLETMKLQVGEMADAINERFETKGGTDG